MHSPTSKLHGKNLPPLISSVADSQKVDSIGCLYSPYFLEEVFSETGERLGYEPSRVIFVQWLTQTALEDWHRTYARPYVRSGKGRRALLRAPQSTRRLLEEGVEVPGYQMSAILNSFKVGG
jgi:hypothetical protein